LSVEEYMKIAVLGSGSKGNAVYVEAGGTAVLFDAGFSGRELKRRMLGLGLDPATLQAIIVSHEHTDHIQGLRVFGKLLPVYATEGTLEQIQSRFELKGAETIRPGKWHKLGGLKFMPVPVSHDAAEPVGFVLEDGSARAAIMTDLGIVTQLVRMSLCDLSMAVIEANHDVDMLLDGPYPWEIKQRVKSRLGHLSNPEAAELISAILHSGLKRVLLGHLSEINNPPDLARAEVIKSLDGSGARLEVCSQARPSEIVVMD
jgi:phosphoribosyl 1,2-cyclic phosphodiesterase